MASIMETDPPYGAATTSPSVTPPPQSSPPEVQADSTADVPSPSSVDDYDLPWWADVIESLELSDVIRNQVDEKLLLIDCRSFIEFNQANIVNSINVCCNKIVKRRLQQNKVKIQEFLSSTCHIEIDSSYTVVIYDQNTTDASQLPEDNIVTILGTKCKQVFSRVRVLYGGFLEFQAQHPSLLETKTKTPSQQATASLSQPCMPVTNIGPTKILPYLYLGSMKDALSSDLAKANGITYVLNVSMTCPKPTHILDGHFLRIPVNDNYSEKLLPYFHEAFQFIDKVREANGCVLVHCLAGISRSPTLAIAYIMRSYNMTSEEAYRYVKEKRVTISPNFNFLGQLLEYEQQITKDNNQAFAGSKRRCIEDLRAELSSPASPVALPRLLPHKLNFEAHFRQQHKPQSPTSCSLTKLRFEQHNAMINKTAHSPTIALSKLSFGAIAEAIPETANPAARGIDEEPEYMTCYAADTIHQNTSAQNSPCGTPTLNIHLLNSNCNNNNGAQQDNTNITSRLSGNTSPNNGALRPSRPMSLSLTSADPLNSQTIKRPQSLGVQLLEDAKVTLPTESKTNEMTFTVDEATPPSENKEVLVSQANTDFKQPDTDSEAVVLREKKFNKLKDRPKSVALAENSPKEKLPTPTTPTVDFLSHASCPVPSSTSALPTGLCETSESQRKSRSLEDMVSQQDVATGLQLTKSSNSISSTGSHNSLHGSLEIIQVS